MKPVISENKTPEAIHDFPDEARQQTGYELGRVQNDLEPENWKPFSTVQYSTVGQGVREIRVQVGTQYRVIYVAKFDDCNPCIARFSEKDTENPES